MKLEAFHAWLEAEGIRSCLEQRGALEFWYGKSNGIRDFVASDCVGAIPSMSSPWPVFLGRFWRMGGNLTPEMWFSWLPDRLPDPINIVKKYRTSALIVAEKKKSIREFVELQTLEEKDRDIMEFAAILARTD